MLCSGSLYGRGQTMSTAQRVSRAFHRLALFLAAIPLLLGGSLSVYIAFELANRLWEQHQKLVCAHEHVAGQKPGENVFDQFDTVKLNRLAVPTLMTPSQSERRATLLPT